MIFAQAVTGLILTIGFGLRISAIYYASFILFPPLALTALFAYIFYRYQLGEADKKHEAAVASRLRRISVIESSILLGSLAILFLVFISLQFTYLFGGDSTITAQGFTYAEYAHRGFFELFAVAMLSFIVVWLSDAKVDKRSVRSTHLFRVLAGTLIVLVALIIVSAFKRLSIYEAAYGYTILRVYTQVFIVMLGAIFLILFIKLVANRHESWFALRAFLLTIAFLIGINIVNVDQVVARLNVERFKATHNQDLLLYNLKLSDDAIDQVISAYDALDPSRCEIWITNGLKNRLTRLKKQSWQSYNVPLARALKKLSLREVDLNAEIKRKTQVRHNGQGRISPQRRPVKIIVDPKTRNLDKTVRDILQISQLVAERFPSTKTQSMAINDCFAVVTVTSPKNTGIENVTLRVDEINGTWRIRGCVFAKSRNGQRKATGANYNINWE